MYVGFGVQAVYLVYLQTHNSYFVISTVILQLHWKPGCRIQPFSRVILLIDLHWVKPHILTFKLIEMKRSVRSLRVIKFGSVTQIYQEERCQPPLLHGLISQWGCRSMNWQMVGVCDQWESNQCGRMFHGQGRRKIPGSHTRIEKAPGICDCILLYKQLNYFWWFG